MIGHEQGRVRPALIISDDLYNEGPSELVIVLPVTSTLKRLLPTMLPVRPPAGGLTTVSHILCDQIRTISRRRLLRRRGRMPAGEIAEAVGIVADLIQA